MGLLSENSESNFGDYINEDEDIGVQDHGGDVQQEKSSTHLSRILFSCLWR